MQFFLTDFLSRSDPVNLTVIIPVVLEIVAVRNM
jgi:hypothetical protein